MIDRLFAALADPTRRRILDLIRVRPRAVGEIADALPVSQPAVSQHLRVLLDAGLVGVRQEGRRRIYHLQAGGLAALRAWTDRMWEDALSAYAKSFEEPVPTDPPEEER